MVVCAYRNCSVSSLERAGVLISVGGGSGEALDRVIAGARVAADANMKRRILAVGTRKRKLEEDVQEVAQEQRRIYTQVKYVKSMLAEERSDSSHRKHKKSRTHSSRSRRLSASRGGRSSSATSSFSYHEHVRLFVEKVNSVFSNMMRVLGDRLFKHSKDLRSLVVLFPF